MKARWALGVAALVAGLAFSGATARAQDDSTKSELEMYKQRTEALEKKVADLEKKTEENAAAEKEQLQRAVERFSAAGPNDLTGPNDFSLRAVWKDNHLWFENSDESLKLGFGGRFNLDAASINGNNNLNKTVGKQYDGTEVRRFRLHVYGTWYDDVSFKFQPDFSVRDKASVGTSSQDKGYTVALKDAYININNVIPYATFRVGHFQEPFNIEELDNDQDYTFMERGLPDVFVPSYQVGAMLYHPILDKRMTYAVGLFRPTDLNENSYNTPPVGNGTNFAYSQLDGGYDIAARVTGLPWYKDNGNDLMHLGAAAVFRDPDRQPIYFAAPPETHLASNFVNTGYIFGTDNVEMVDGEAIIIHGPFEVESQVTDVQVNRSGTTSDPNFTSGYAYVSYMITGEHKGYDRNTGYEDRLIPFHNLGSNKDGVRGWGAFEVAARYSWLDLNSCGIRGGRLNDGTLGVNWYMNPNVRLMLNYVYADLTDAAASPHKGIANIVETRLGIDF